MLDIERPVRERDAFARSTDVSGERLRAVSKEPSAHAEDASFPALLVISAATAEALRDLATSWVGYLSTLNAGDFHEVCGASITRRQRFRHALHVVAETPDAAGRKISAWLSGNVEPGVRALDVEVRRRQLVFAFTGQGAQRPGIGSALYRRDPAFRAAFDACAKAAGRLDVSLSDLVLSQRHAKELDQTRYAQPALFALEYSLFRSWEARGIRPDYLIGHSLGEYVAATCAGVWALEDAMPLVIGRARLMQSLPEGGGMLAVGAPEGDVRARLERGGFDLELGALNADNRVVVTGALVEIARFADSLERDHVPHTRLRVSGAFHSKLMEPILPEFSALLSSVRFAEPRLPIASNLTGRLEGARLSSPDYWVQQLRKTVRFAEGVRALGEAGVELGLELGPASTLCGIVPAIGAARKQHWLPSFGAAPELASIEEAFGEVLRYRDDPAATFNDAPRSNRRPSLPHYPFQRRRFWREGASLEAATAAVARDSLPVAVARESLFQAVARNPESPVIDLGPWQPVFEKAKHLSPEQQARWLVTITSALQALDSETPVSSEWKRWLYDPSWLPISNPRSRAGAPRREPVLVIADRQGIGDALSRRLEELGVASVVVSQGPSGPSARRERIEDELARVRPARIVYLCPLDLKDSPEGEPASLREQYDELTGILRRLPELHRQGAEARLWLVTRRAVPAGSFAGQLNLSSAPLLGLADTVALEVPSAWAGTIDLDGGGPLRAARQLAAEILGDEAESRVAYRGGQRFAPRLVRDDEDVPRQPARIHADACYLVTGGLGGIGLSVAEWLAKKGAGTVVLMSRRRPSAEALETLRAWGRSGVVFRTVQGDVSNLEDVRRAVAAGGEQPLRGVFHAAGVEVRRPVLEQSWEEFDSILAPKVKGTLNLHLATLGADLEHFVLFSSIASVWGSASLGAYTAANRFQDSFAQYRHAQGRSALSLNWGPWQDTGMAAGETLEWLQKSGLGPMSPEQALLALDHMLSEGGPQKVVTDVDWPRFLDLFGLKGRTELFTLLRSESPGESAEVPIMGSCGEDSCAVPKGPAPATASEPPAMNAERSERIRGIVAKALGFAPQDLEPGVPLQQLGLDSMMATEIRSALAAMGVPVDLRALIAGSTLNDLVRGGAAEAPRAETPPPSRVLASDAAAAPRALASDAAAAPRTTPVDEGTAPAAPPRPAAPRPRASVTADSWVVLPAPNPDARVRLFCFPYAGGGPPAYYSWPQRLPSSIEVAGIQLPGRGTRIHERPAKTMAELLDPLRQSLLPHLERPYAFFGHCFGALVMYELVQDLVSRGHAAPVHLFVSGARAPHCFTNEQYLRDIMQYSPVRDVPGFGVPDPDFIGILKDLNFETSKVLFEDPEMQRIMFPIIRADLQANDTYRYSAKPPLEVPITIVGGRVDPYVNAEQILGWRQHTRGSFRFHFRPGDHYFVANESEFILNMIARELGTAGQEARR